MEVQTIRTSDAILSCSTWKKALAWNSKAGESHSGLGPMTVVVQARLPSTWRLEKDVHGDDDGRVAGVPGQ